MRELLATMDAAELAEWEAYYHVEPWGDVRGDYQAAMLGSVLANLFRSKGTPAKAKDFIPEFWGEDARRDNTAKMLAIGRAFAASTRAKQTAQKDAGHSAGKSRKESQ